MFRKYLIGLLLIMGAYSDINAIEDSLQKIIDLQVRKFKYILDNAAQYHKDSIDVIKSSDLAFRTLLNSFDKNSEYYSKDVISKLNERNKGLTVGIGIDVFPINDTLTIINVAKKSPAELAELKVGDQLLFIDDVSTSRMERAEVLNRLSGDTSTKVSLIIKDFEIGNLKPIVITRSIYESFSVSPPILLDNDVVYFKLGRFSELTSKEFKEYSKEIVDSNPNYVIIDLRGNTGGYLGQAVEIADQFIGDSLLICQTVSKVESFREKFYAKENGFFEKLPLLVLVDSISASGSEILAAAVQDYDRGLIVGTQTYGKATAQRLINMVDSTAFKLTVAEYITPLGRKLQRLVDTLNSKLDENADVILDANSKKNIEELINKYGGKDKLDIYKTRKGRVLFSPWGILPDVKVAKDTNTALTNVLRARGVFLEWALEFYTNNKDNYKEEFSNFDKFKKMVLIDELKLEQFKGFCINKKLWNNEMYQIDKQRIAVNMKSVLAFVIFGSKESNEIMLENDIFVKTALENLEKAKLLFNN